LNSLCVFFFTVSADYLQEFNKPFAVDENRVATTICYGRIIVVWNTFDGGVVCTFDTKVRSLFPDAIFFRKDQIFSSSRSRIFEFNYCEFGGIETHLEKLFSEVGLQCLAPRPEPVVVVAPQIQEGQLDGNQNENVNEIPNEQENAIASNNVENIDESEEEEEIDFYLVGIGLSQNVFVVCYLINNSTKDCCTIKLAFVTKKSCRGKIDFFRFFVSIVTLAQAVTFSIYFIKLTINFTS
jgi:hypothetical protein